MAIVGWWSVGGSRQEDLMRPLIETHRDGIDRHDDAWSCPHDIGGTKIEHRDISADESE
jgi:hypothetical protein